MGAIVIALHKFIAFFNWFGEWLPQLGLRLLLAWEYWESGVEKYNGENWFGDIQQQFPFPFNQLPVDISWNLAMWTELVGSLMLVLGFGTRFAGIALLILTVVATAAVHWPQEWHTLSDLLKGYAITDKGFGNYKLPLIFIIMLLPLILSGAGRLSIDSLFSLRYRGERG